MACKMCEARGQTWSGSAPKCAFEGSRPFSGDNWNCATVNAIRDLISPDNEAERPPGIVYLWANDQHYALIDSGGINTSGAHGPADMTARFGGPLYVEWYKHRGATERMLIMGNTPTPPTEGHLLRLLQYYKPETPTE